MSLAESFGRSAFSRFINAPAGRLGRVVAGLALIAWGAMHLSTSWGLAVLLFGLLPLATGAIDWCVLSALLGGPLTGRRLRDKS
jgi:hypothetical protein